MPDLIEFEGGDILAGLEPLTITGLLLPYNEVGRTNVGRFQVEAGSVELPSDPVIVGVNTDHVRQDVVGRAISLTETPAGVLATIKFADTAAGRAAHEDAINPAGIRRRLSAEFGPAVIRGGRLVAGHAKLWGAALVEAGAFPSAQVLAADTPTLDIVDPAAPAAPVDQTATDPAPAPVPSPSVTTEKTETLEDGTIRTTLTTVTTTTIIEPDASAAADTTGATAVPIPNTLASAATPAAPQTTAPQILAAIATLRSNPGDSAAHQVLAALQNITIGGSGSLTSPGVMQPNWVGELADGLAYVRQYVPLHKLGTNITAEGKKGFKIARGTSGSPLVNFDGSWAGNKTDIPSGVGRTSTQSSTLDRFAFGADIGREFYDLPGGIEVLDAFLKLVLEDHLYWSDQKALALIQATAGAPVAPKTFPTDYPGTLGMILQGILAVKRPKADNRRDKPTYAILNPVAYEELLYTPFENVPEFIKFAVNTDGTGTADGDVIVVEGETGIEDTPSVIVGADYAIEFDELAGGPIHVDALEIAKGGIDRAVHGYLQKFVRRPEALVLIGTADV